MTASLTDTMPPPAVALFMQRWQKAGGSERANYRLFLTELCALLDLPLPEPAGDDTRDYAAVLSLIEALEELGMVQREGEMFRLQG